MRWFACPCPPVCNDVRTGGRARGKRALLVLVVGIVPFRRCPDGSGGGWAIESWLLVREASDLADGEIWDNRLLMDAAAGLSPPVIAWEVWVGGGDLWSGHLQIGLCRNGLVGERTFVL